MDGKILMTEVRFIAITPSAEPTMAYIARVSSPANQDNPDYEKLLRYCIQHEHWSVFEHAYMTLEIETSLAIATQILRHRSFTFQQFSQRYAKSDLEFEPVELRDQDTKNRQNSLPTKLSPEDKDIFRDDIKDLLEGIGMVYNNMLDAGLAKEVARMILPQCTRTKLYMTGNCRNWIHYIQLRTANGTQQEHMQIARGCKEIFKQQFPTVSKALEW